jgi:hypothetical protein
VVTYVTPREIEHHLLDLTLLHAPYLVDLLQEVILQGPLADAMALGGRTMDPSDGPLRTDKK